MADDRRQQTGPTTISWFHGRQRHIGLPARLLCVLILILGTLGITPSAAPVGRPDGGVALADTGATATATTTATSTATPSSTPTAIATSTPASLLANGSFENGLSGWATQASGGSTAVFTTTSGTAADGVSSAMVTTTNASGGTGSVALSQSNLQLVAGTTYTASCWVLPPAGSTVYLQLQGSGVQHYALTQDAAAQWQRLTLSVVAPSSVSVGLSLYQAVPANSTIYWDGCTLTGSAGGVPGLAGAGANLLANPQFSGGTNAPWANLVTAPALVTSTNVISATAPGGQMAQVSVAADGTYWHAGFGQTGLSLQAGVYYTLRFALQCAVPASFEGYVQQSGGSAYLLGMIKSSCQPGWEYYTVSFLAPLAGAAKVGFNLRYTATTYYLADVTLAPATASQGSTNARLAPLAGGPGYTGAITGTGFTPASSVPLYLDGTMPLTDELAVATTDGTGAFTQAVSLRASASLGLHPLLAADPSLGSVPLGADATIVNTALASVPASGLPGASVVLTGTSFAATSPYTVTWGTLGGPVLASGTTSSTGSFTATVTVPLTATSGMSAFVATDGVTTANVPFTALAAPTATPTVTATASDTLTNSPTVTPSSTPTATATLTATPATDCAYDGTCITGFTSTAGGLPVGVGTSVTLAVSASSDVSGTPWFLDIADEHGVVVGTCATGSTCQTTVTSAVAATHTYTAWLSLSGSSVGGMGAKGGAIAVTWQAGPTPTPGPTLAPTGTPVPAGCLAEVGCVGTFSVDGATQVSTGATVQLVAYMSFALGTINGNPYWVQIQDENGNWIGSCVTGTICTIYVSSGVATSHVYTAWLEGSISGHTFTSNGGPSVGVAWNSTPMATATATPAASACAGDGTCLSGLSASPASTVPVGSSVSLRAGTNRDIASSLWYILIVDEHGNVVQVCGSGTTCAASVSSSAAASHSYTAWLSTSPSAVSGGGPSLGPLTVTWASALTPTATPTAAPSPAPGCVAGGWCLRNLQAATFSNGTSCPSGGYCYATMVSMPNLTNTGWFVVITDELGTVQPVFDGVHVSTSTSACIYSSANLCASVQGPYFSQTAHRYTAWLTTNWPAGIGAHFTPAPGAGSLSVDVSWFNAPTLTRTPVPTATGTPTSTLTATATPTLTTTPSGSPTATATPGPGCAADGTCLTGFTASPASPVLPGTSVTLTANANKDVGDTSWFIDIVNTASGAVLRSCASGGSCTLAVSSTSMSDTEIYQAYLSTSPAALSPSAPSLGPLSITWSGPAPTPSATASPTTTLYLRNKFALHGNSTLPGSAVGGWPYSPCCNTNTTGAAALAMDTLSGTSAGILAASPNSSSESEAAQFLSLPLAGGQVLNGTFGLGFATMINTVSQGYYYPYTLGYAYVGVLNAAGQRVATLLPLQQVGADTDPGTDMIPLSVSFPASYTTQPGDMLVVEVGALRYAQAPCIGSQCTQPGQVGYDGSTPISQLTPNPATGQTSDSPQSYLQVPANLQFLAVPLTNDSGAVPWHVHYPVSLPAGMSVDVDLADGHFDLQYSDLSVPARGPDLALVHTWDSGAALAGTSTGAGMGWNTGLTARMSGASGSTVNYTDSTGGIWQFGYSTAKSAYLSPLGLPETLIATTSGYTLTNFLTGEILAFNAQGQFVSDTDSYGNADTFSADGSTYANSGGRALTMHATGGLLTDVYSPLWQSSSGGQGQHVSYAYSGGQLTAITRGAGTADAQTTSFTYYPNNLLQSIVTPKGETWWFTYDDRARLEGITTTGPGGFKYVCAFSYLPPIYTQVNDGAGPSDNRQATYYYDGSGQLVDETLGNGGTVLATGYHDPQHDALSSMDANGNITVYQYQYAGPDGNVGLLREVDSPPISPGNPLAAAVAPATYNVYDSTTWDLVQTSTSAGAITDYVYDGHHGLLATSTLASLAPVAWRTSVNAYDQYGELVSSTDGRGVSGSGYLVSRTDQAACAASSAGCYTSTYTYSPSGDRLAASVPVTATVLGVAASVLATTSYTYDADGDQTSATTPNQNTTTTIYDHLGRPVKMIAPRVALFDGSTTQPASAIQYDGDGNVITQTDPDGNATTQTYDPLGRVLSSSNPISGTTIMTYTGAVLSAEQDPQGNVTSYGYDDWLRTISVANGAGQETSYAYGTSANGEIQPASVSSGGYEVYYEYDALDRQSGELRSSLEGWSTNSYDLAGNLVRSQQPNGDVNFQTYDLGGDLVSQETDTGGLSALQPAGANTKTFAYDGAGNLVLTKDYDGHTTTQTFDGADRVIQSVASYTTAQGTALITTTQQLDADGNLLQSLVTGSDGSTHVITSTYNALDWLTSSGDDGFVTTYGYDAAGRQKTVQKSGAGAGWSFKNYLDAKGRVTSIAETTSGTDTDPVGFSYNGNDAVTQVALPAGVSESMTYNGASQVSSVALSGPAGLGPNATYGYGYDAGGLTSSLSTSSNGGPAITQALSHDPAGHLSALTGPGVSLSWTYDQNDNLLQAKNNYTGAASTYTYAGSGTTANELVSLATSNGPTLTYGYDSAGNTTAITSTASLTPTTMGYDAENRLSAVTLPNGTTVRQGYDAQGLRGSYSVTPAGASAPKLAEAFSYMGGQLTQMVLTLSGTVAYTDTYVYGPTGEPLELLRNTNGSIQRYWYETDGRGSVVALTDSNGNVVDQYSYDVWGAPVQVIETVPQQLRYDGYWWDNEVAWYWLSIRAYDPVLKRFLQVDPSGQDGQFSYVYAGDHPVDASDPSGLFACVSPGFTGPLAPDEAYCYPDGSMVYYSTVTGQWETYYPPTVGQTSPTALDNADSGGDVFGQAWDYMAGDDFSTLFSNAGPGAKFLAFADLASNALLLVPVGGDAADAAVKGGLRELGEYGLEDSEAIDRSLVREGADAAASCVTQCFPAGTLVATPKGEQAIETLRVGDLVLAEDPATRKVEPEPVEALIKDPSASFMAIDLSDGTSVRVTPNHPFWVDSGRQLKAAGWFLADQLWPGDQLRLATGKDVTVVRLRYDQGQAVAYTLTVANDHTYFVGADRVLVHNCALDSILGSDTRTFTRYLQSLQSQAARTGVSPLTAQEAQELWDSAISRGFTAPRGVETSWVGGLHVNLIGPGGGPNIHFPVPAGWTPPVP